MEEAGWSREGGTWTKDGQPFQATIATSAQTPVFETTVSNQLQNFGMDVDFQTYEGATFQDRVWGSDSQEKVEGETGGNFDVWTGVWPANNLAGYYSAAARYWYGAVAKRERARARNIYARDKQEKQLVNYGTAGWSYLCVPECQMEWTIDVPPIGEPDGERQKFNPSYVYNWTLFEGRAPTHPYDEDPYYNPPDSDQHSEANATHYWQTFIWTLNWFLPGIPCVLSQNQHFLNTQNFDLTRDHPMWQYFGMNWDATNMAGMGRVTADPQDPKPGATVVEDDE